MLHLQTSTKSSSLSPRLSSSLPHLQHKHEQTREQKENQWRALIRRGSAPALLPLSLFFHQRCSTRIRAPSPAERRPRSRPINTAEAPSSVWRQENKRGRPDKETSNANSLNEEKLSARKHFAGKVSRDGESSGRRPRGSSRYHRVGEGKGGKNEISLLFIARILASPQPLGDGFLPAGRP